MKKLLIVLLFPLQVMAQELPGSVVFWNTLQAYCGKAYEGEITAGGKEGDGYTGEKLVMHVRTCEEKTIQIPFFCWCRQISHLALYDDRRQVNSFETRSQT